MKAIPLFIGPTWPELHAAPPPGYVVLPPARFGDVSRLIDIAPPAIAIVDGVFEHCRALWHKEILLALEAGIAVFGAASLGALRAAELHPFGMIGVGAIFERYRSGDLDRDDAVVVPHAPAELDFAPLGVALVDIEATINGAGDGLTGDEARLLKSIAALTFFKDRTWETITARFGERTGDATRTAKLSELFTRRAISAKRADVVALIAVVDEWRVDRPRPAPIFVPRTPWMAGLPGITLGTGRP